MSGKVIVNRCMSLDGFIAGPGPESPLPRAVSCVRTGTRART
jgi:hypothetical protein